MIPVLGRPGHVDLWACPPTSSVPLCLKEKQSGWPLRNNTRVLSGDHTLAHTCTPTLTASSSLWNAFSASFNFCFVVRCSCLYLCLFSVLFYLAFVCLGTGRSRVQAILEFAKLPKQALNSQSCLLPGRLQDRPVISKWTLASRNSGLQELGCSQVARKAGLTVHR